MDRVYVLKFTMLMGLKEEIRQEVYSYGERSRFIERYEEIKGKWCTSNVEAYYADLTSIPDDVISARPF